MNIGQIYETVLGWAGKKLGLKFATPIFDGAELDQITEYTEKQNFRLTEIPTYMTVVQVRDLHSLRQLG